MKLLISSNIYSVQQGSWMEELRKLVVDIKDVNGGELIELLRADVAGKLYTAEK